jgi:flagellar biogenesis protein FliO
MKKNNQEKDELEKSLDRFGVGLIKVIGIVILVVFWYWLLKKLF